MIEEGIATALADRITENGYPVVSEGERNELRDAIRQEDLIVMSRDLSKLRVLKIAIEKFLQTMALEVNTITVALIVGAIDLQHTVQDAIDEINDEMYLETYHS